MSRTIIKSFLYILFGASCTFAQDTIVPPRAMEQEEVDIYSFPDTEPEFPGGQAAMLLYIVKNVEYPVEAIKNNEQGKVYLQFVIEMDGSLSNIEVIRSISPSLDKEAVRVIRNMPKWKSATYKGRNIRSRYNLPVDFRLSD